MLLTRVQSFQICLRSGDLVALDKKIIKKNIIINIKCKGPGKVLVLVTSGTALREEISISKNPKKTLAPKGDTGYTFFGQTQLFSIQLVDKTKILAAP